jgi:hypothetical protein
MRTRLTIGDRSAIVTLLDNATARDFVSLLPISLNMHELLRRQRRRLSLGLSQTVASPSPSTASPTSGIGPLERSRDPL